MLKLLNWLSKHHVAQQEDQEAVVQIHRGAKISKIEAEDNGVEGIGMDGGEEVELLLEVQVDDQED